MKPGKHEYIVSDLRRKGHEHVSMHTFEAEPRLEEVANFERITKYVAADAFNRQRSIWGAWPEEDEAQFRACISHDTTLWKVPRLIKDEIDYLNVIEVLLKHAKLLAHLFTYISGKSSFPSVGMLDFSQFCHDCHIYDDEFKPADVDRYFIAATGVNLDTAERKGKRKTKMEKEATKAELVRLRDPSSLKRYQFVEMLVRIA